MFPVRPLMPALLRTTGPVLLLLAVLSGLVMACSGEPATPVIPTARPTSTPAPTSAPAIAPTPTKPSATPVPSPTAVPPTSTPTAEPPPTPAPTATPRPEGPLVSLPADEAPHETPIEWWYFNGFLWDEDGKEYSFHYVTFQSPTLPVGTPHLLHATLGIHADGQHFAGERPALARLDPDAPSVDIDAEGWVMRGGAAGDYDLWFDLGGRSVELEATSTREPVLHDSTGLVAMGEAGETYYYSRTRMELEGWLQDADGRHQVHGSGWMDHQWGKISRVDVGWDWVNLHLDDGSDLMVAVVWKPAPPDAPCANAPCPVAGQRVAAYATFVHTDGTVTHVPGEGVSMDAVQEWTSPSTGIPYPSGWRLRVEPLEVDLFLEPVLANAEFDAGEVLPVVYWEGAVAASGSARGASVEGRGFAELVGYDPNQSSADIPMP